MDRNEKVTRAATFVLTLLSLGVASHGQPSMAQSAGTFTATGSMIAHRAAHTATLLPNGKVLIAGGRSIGLGGGGPVWAGTELYDPTTGAFSSTRDMTTSRWLHTATLLPNGKVLIAGGMSGSNYALASAEIYDPSTGTFAATGHMHRARHRHTATLLNDGKVLIAGGALTDFSNSSLASAELYDSSTGVFISTGDMNRARFAHTATLLGDGTVLIDSSHPESEETGSSEGYNPLTGTFNLIGRTTDGGAETATLLINGKVLVTRTSEGAICCVELYDPSTGAFAPTGEMVRMANQFTATLIPDGTVLIAGGYPFGESLLYDPVTGMFSPAGSMGIFRRWHTATLLSNGAVLIVGGYDTAVATSQAMLGDPVSLNSAQLYTPTVLAPSPVLFPLSGDGQGPGVIVHAGTDQVVSPNNPAVGWRGRSR